MLPKADTLPLPTTAGFRRDVAAQSEVKPWGKAAGDNSRGFFPVMVLPHRLFQTAWPGQCLDSMLEHLASLPRQDQNGLSSK